MKYKVIGILFEVTKKRYYFEVKQDEKFKKNDKLVVETIRGEELGTAYSDVMELEEEKLVLPLKPVIKKANKKDIDKYNELCEESKKAFQICKEKIAEHKLPMKLIESEFTLDKSKLIFYFSAEGRIDFRNLVKDLAAIFRLRIELRQIGVRDEARILGNTGICGLKLCCRNFINKFDSVSIKMARDQGLVINPSKISGACGRLLCCIKYENNEYEEQLEKFPAIGQDVKALKDKGRVTGINPLNGFLYVDVREKGVSKYNIEDVIFDKKRAEEMKRNSEFNCSHSNCSNNKLEEE